MRPRLRRDALPRMIGGCGFWSGFGYCQIGSKLTTLPWYSAASCVQMRFMASTRSRRSVQRPPKPVPWFSISSTFQPAADSEQDAAARQLIERRHFLGGDDGIALDQEADAGGELDRLRDGGRGHQRHEGIVRVPVVLRQVAAGRVGRRAARGDVRVLREPDRFEATLLAGAGEIVGADAVVGGEDGDAELHVSTPVPGTGSRRQTGWLISTSSSRNCRGTSSAVTCRTGGAPRSRTRPCHARP